ncbi:hypothetical protein [Adlercreutzia murintestinalis]|jgi:hypothetical protein|uniref:hypothetical protein n=1 Tax=Adlercreutzia murintestinalis TaxID=2941325 RepID=UPI00203E31F6|nr:hypothetical protein [Adlercreutzia murintestinalis]
MTAVGQGAIASDDIVTNNANLWATNDSGLISVVNSSVSKFSSEVQSAIVDVDKRMGISDPYFITKSFTMFSPSAGELISGYANDGFGDDHNQTYLFYQDCAFEDDRLKLGYIYRTRTNLTLDGRYISRVISVNATAWGWAYFGYPEGYIPLADTKLIACFCF